MNILSLFDGIRTGHLALNDAGIKVDKYYSSEINEKSIMIGDKNFPQDIKYKLGDVTKIDEEKLKQLDKIDLIIFGSPCTGFSRQGKMLNFDDPQSKLFFEALRILNWLKENNNPNIKFFMENVEMKKEWKLLIDEYLNTEGILINSKVLTAQNRPRVYWTNIVDKIHITNKTCNLIDIIDNNIDTINYIRHEGLLIDPGMVDKNKKVLNLIYVVNGEVRIKQATKKGYIVAENGDGINLSFPSSTTRRGRVIKQKSSTLDQSCNVCIYYDNIIRALNINELERLQTLPDNYTYLENINEKDRKSAIGNGWTKDVIVEFFKHLTIN